MLHSLVYVSTCDRRITGVDLQALLRQSRAHNAAREITGLLLYQSGTFLQLIEGSEREVESLFASIAVDERHHDVVLVRRRTQQRRQFPRWTMAYGDVDLTSTEPVAVEMPPPDGPYPQSADEAGFVLELLELFDAPRRPLGLVLPATTDESRGPGEA